MLVAIGLNRLSGLQTPLCYIALVYSFLFPLEGFENTGDSRNRNSEVFYSFYFQENYRYAATKL